MILLCYFEAPSPPPRVEKEPVVFSNGKGFNIRQKVVTSILGFLMTRREDIPLALIV
jgi:hypothetical protein